MSVLTHCLRRPNRTAAIETGNYKKLVIVGLTINVERDGALTYHFLFSHFTKGSFGQNRGKVEL